MQALYKILKNPIKWLSLTALVATLGFALTLQLAHDLSYSEADNKILVIEMEEASPDAEQLPQLDDTNEIPSTNRQLQFSGNLNPHHLFYSEFAPRLAFLYHIRPRSPPELQTS